MSNGSTNESRLWALVVPTITCDYCKKKKEGPGSDDTDFAVHLSKEGWTVRENDDRVKCPTCKKKGK